MHIKPKNFKEGSLFYTNTPYLFLQNQFLCFYKVFRFQAVQVYVIQREPGAVRRKDDVAPRGRHDGPVPVTPTAGEHQ